MDARRHAPAADRNKGPIAEVLAQVLPERGTVLEVASGTGQHVAHFAARFPGLVWQPSEIDRALHPSIEAWVRAAGAGNVRPVVALDVTAREWPLGNDQDRPPELAAIYNANMIHISPWDTCLGLMRGAARHLREGGALILYGPYKVGSEHTAPSNARFDRQLRAQDPSWGVRDLEDVIDAAARQGLVFERRFAMPANNMVVVFSS